MVGYLKMFSGHNQRLSLPIVNWEIILSVVASVLLVASQMTYIRHIWTRRIQPTFLSWLGWGMLMLATAFVQGLEEGFAIEQLTLFMSGTTCLIIGSTAWLRKQYLRVRFDLQYLVLGVLCFFLYLIFDNAWVSTVFALIADLLMGIPTIKSALNNPKKERSYSWILAWFSWMISVVLCIGGPIIFLSFPLYLFAWCSLMLILVYPPRKVNQ